MQSIKASNLQMTMTKRHNYKPN